MVASSYRAATDWSQIYTPSHFGHSSVARSAACFTTPHGPVIEFKVKPIVSANSYSASHNKQKPTEIEATKWPNQHVRPRVRRLASKR